MKVGIDEIIESLVITVSLSEIANNSTIREHIDGIKKMNNKDDYISHSKGTTFIALNIAKEMRLNEEDLKNLYIAAYLHDLGLTKVAFMEYDEESITREHCLEGARLISNIPKIEKIAEYVKYHHENYDGTGPFGLAGEQIPLMSQILKISDFIDSNYIECSPEDYKWIISILTNDIDKYVSSSVGKAVIQVISKKTLWRGLNDPDFMDKWMESNKPIIKESLNTYEFLQVAEVYAEIIDIRSSFTAMHSRGISELAYTMGKYKGYDENKAMKLKIAGLLHDIGKLAVPIKYINKNGALTDMEYKVVKTHVVYTDLVLKPITSINDIREWAISHHEKLDGTGYSRELKHNELGEEQRLLAICDIYQALAEDRPYRRGLKREKCLEIIGKMVENNKLCPKAFEVLKCVTSNL
ncbi:HD-GYP domain-containing protein [Clostridium sp. 'White wine YQ']|uniref:HD-GYP domain-containing protein n=1 Tax=Clostridium sp. 'White wine YQ' TaxID=3027474 RepID=UPI002366BE6C|nr:HD domain-containing phosphohydrolase [Clostridium sp. 'White wine YQ']MDD7795166.1 HD domain-containing protein [Clostridium sp. 'White wine YQ']